MYHNDGHRPPGSVLVRHQCGTNKRTEERSKYFVQISDSSAGDIYSELLNSPL